MDDLGAERRSLQTEDDSKRQSAKSGADAQASNVKAFKSQPRKFRKNEDSNGSLAHKKSLRKKRSLWLYSDTGRQILSELNNDSHNSAPSANNDIEQRVAANHFVNETVSTEQQRFEPLQEHFKGEQSSISANEKFVLGAYRQSTGMRSGLHNVTSHDQSISHADVLTSKSESATEEQFSKVGLNGDSNAESLPTEQEYVVPDSSTDEADVQYHHYAVSSETTDCEHVVPDSSDYSLRDGQKQNYKMGDYDDIPNKRAVLKLKSSRDKARATKYFQLLPTNSTLDNGKCKASDENQPCLSRQTHQASKKSQDHQKTQILEEPIPCHSITDIPTEEPVTENSHVKYQQELVNMPPEQNVMIPGTEYIKEPTGFARTSAKSKDKTKKKKSGLKTCFTKLTLKSKGDDTNECKKSSEEMIRDLNERVKSLESENRKLKNKNAALEISKSAELELTQERRRINKLNKQVEKSFGELGRLLKQLRCEKKPKPEFKVKSLAARLKSKLPSIVSMINIENVAYSLRMMKVITEAQLTDLRRRHGDIEAQQCKLAQFVRDADDRVAAKFQKAIAEDGCNINIWSDDE